jgi:hypothetical protein
MTFPIIENPPDLAYVCVKASYVTKLETALRDVQSKLTRVVEPWIGVRADIIPSSVTAIVPLLNDLQSVLFDSTEETKGDAT